MINILALLFAKMFEKGTMFLFFILLAQTFGKEAVGEFSYYFTIATLFFILFDLGGEFYQIREFSKAERLRIFNSIFILKTFIFCLTLTFILLFSNSLYLLLLFISYYFDSIISIFRSSLYKNGQQIKESKLTVIEKCIFLAIVFFNVLTIKHLTVMYFAFTLSKLLYVLILTKKFYKIRYICNAKKLFDLNFVKKYLINSWSYVLHALLVVIFVQIDILMLKQMNVSFADIGLYSAAVKIYMAVIIFADVLFKFYYPIVARYVQNKDKEPLKALVLKIQNTNLFFSIYFAAFTMLFAREIILLAFGNEFYESGTMLTIFAIIIIFRFSMYTYTAVLSSSSLNHIKLYTSFGCAATNIGLNYALIPSYGVYGAIIATVTTEFLLVVLYKITSLKIVFTNILTRYEFIIVLTAFSLLYLFLNHQFSLFAKALIFLFIALSLALNYKSIKAKLNFQRMENV